jgi:polysaccharide chain length determinant protein (PEP-CTERM system associated)
MSEELDDQVFLSGEEYWAIVVRRRWWFLLPLFLGWAVVWGASWFLPATYQSESLILVEQQKVPDQYVTPNFTSDLQQRLQSLTEQILSRTRLQATIDGLHLYPKSSGNLDSVDPVEQMRNDIKIELVSAPDHPGEYTAFRMRYSARTPELAQKVNAELSSIFIAENVNTQRQLSENTTAFLDSQLADARVNMAEQESKVAAFKARHLGELPGQLESNMQILAGLQSQLQGSQQTLDAARQQKLYLDSMLQQYQSVGGADSLSPAETLESQLVAMRQQLRELQSRYTDSYPDVIALKGKIAHAEQLQIQTETEMAEPRKDGKAANASGSPDVVITPHSSSTPMMQLQSQLKANQLEIANIQHHQKDLESQITSYQARLNLTPETEQELTGVSRGYEESKTNYNSLLQKQMQSQLATSLEHRQQGQQFRILDPPSYPKKPSAPNHLRFSLVGLLVGACLGLSLMTIMEMTDVRVRQEKDLAGILSENILVGIPLLSTPWETRTRLLRSWTEIGAMTGMLVLITLGNLYAFYKG